MHQPVLLKSAIDYLGVFKGGRYIDATIGEGGHTKAIVEKGGLVLGIDQDQDQIKLLKKFFEQNKLGEIKLVVSNFSQIDRIAKENDFVPVDGIIFDLGLSMRQLSQSGRGFSYKKPDDPLDMRLDLKQELTAAKLIKKLSPERLKNVLEKNSEEINAEAIVKQLKKTKKIYLVADLLRAIDKALERKNEAVYQRVFQALRMAVNNDQENLKQGLLNSLKILKRTGRIVVISFHSVEDRLVKKFIKENHLKMINKKIIKGNRCLSFERSAKLRVISF